jgi:hypothetical protein
MSSFKLELASKIAENKLYKQKQIYDTIVRTKDIYIDFVKYEHKKRIRKLEDIIAKLKKSNKKLRKEKKATCKMPITVKYCEDSNNLKLKLFLNKCYYIIAILIYITLVLLLY